MTVYFGDVKAIVQRHGTNVYDVYFKDGTAHVAVAPLTFDTDRDLDTTGNIAKSINGFYNIQRDGGADGLGVTSASGALQGGFDLAPRLAGTGIDIWVPPGQYNLTDPVLVRGTTRLHCAGTNLVQFYAPGVTGALFKSADTATVINHPVFQGFTVNGGNSTTLTAGVDWTGMNTALLRDIDVKNIVTANASGIMAVGSIADSSGAVLDNCGAYGIAGGFGFKFQSLNGLSAAHLKGTANKMCVFLNAITESDINGILTSDNTNTSDASSMKVQNCNRTNIVNLVADDNKWINVFINANTNCQFSNWNINDNNHAFTVGNGGLLYVAGPKHCSFNNINLEFVFSTPGANTNGLTLDNASAGQSQFNTFNGLHVNGNTKANLRAIHWVPGASGLNNQFKNVTLSGCGVYETPLELPDAFSAFDCRTGIVTRNGGVPAPGTGSEQSIAHGLSFTPTQQQIVLIPGSATADPYHSHAPDATNIYVTAANLQQWYWTTPG